MIMSVLYTVSSATALGASAECLRQHEDCNVWRKELRQDPCYNFTRRWNRPAETARHGSGQCQTVQQLCFCRTDNWKLYPATVSVFLVVDETT